LHFTDPFACSHQRAPDYFSESIRSLNGFWGYACESYISYLLGLCPLNNNQVVAGEDASSAIRGLFLVQTNAVAPFAIGRIPAVALKHGILHPNSHLIGYRDPLQKEIDQWGKLDGDFNNLENFPTPYSQDPNGHNWIYFDDKLTTPDSPTKNLV
jgi:pancreatic lipase-related protein 2